MRVALCDDPRLRLHDAGPGHPERPERLDAVRRGLQERDLERRLCILRPQVATEAELLRVHTPEHVARIQATVGLRADIGPSVYALALVHAEHWPLLET